MVKVSELIPTHALTLSRRERLKLEADVAKNGILQPIKYVIFCGGKYVVDGHHRLQAARKLKFNDVPAEEVQLPFCGYTTDDDLSYTDGR